MLFSIIIEFFFSIIILFQLPDSVRTQPERLSPDDTLSAILGRMKKPPSDSQNLYTFKSNVLNKPPEYLEKKSSLKSFFDNIYDWHFMFLTSSKNSPDLKIFIGRY